MLYALNKTHIQWTKDFEYKAKIILVQYHAFSDIITGESKMKNGIVVNAFT